MGFKFFIKTAYHLVLLFFVVSSFNLFGEHVLELKRFSSIMLWGALSYFVFMKVYKFTNKK